MSRLDEIAARTEASRSASGTNFRVVGITVDGGYSVEATDLFEGGVDVATHGYLPEETAELFAHAPADLADLVTFARAMEGLHRPRKVICLNPSHGSDCDAMVCDACDTPWPCPTAKALDQIGGAS